MGAACEGDECVIDSPETSDMGVGDPGTTVAPLEVTLAVEKLGAGGVAFVLTATNRHALPLMLAFRSGQTGDVTVTTPDGAPIWRWSTGRFFTQAIREYWLDPGQSREVRLEWREAVVMLASAPAPWQAWATWVSLPGGSTGPVDIDLIAELGNE